MSEYQAPQYAAPRPYAGPHKPGKVQAIAIMTLIDGILNVLYGLFLAGFMGLLGGIGSGGVLCLCIPSGLFALTVGILEIVGGAQLLSTPPKVQGIPKYVAIMQILNITSGNVFSLVIGILALAFSGDPEVAAYFHQSTGVFAPGLDSW
jgi:hypothetical protein